eukprot:scaffold391_cov223-Pinguiococcus_pyrenoidosus.AAC.9
MGAVDAALHLQRLIVPLPSAVQILHFTHDGAKIVQRHGNACISGVRTVHAALNVEHLLEQLSSAV